MKETIHKILSERYPAYVALEDDEARDDFWRELNDQEKYGINEQHLRETENPEYDYLVCWEPGRLDTGEKVTDYDNLYDLDYNWWKFQKDAQWESIEESKKWMEEEAENYPPEKVAESINSFNERYEKGYSIYLSGDWYRLIENDVFIYCQFISAKWYLFYKAEQLLDELQEKHIPYEFRSDDLLESINERNPVKVYDAGGREIELESYQEKIRKYTSTVLFTLLDFLLTKYKVVFSGKTFRVDTGYEPGENFDPFTDFIFYDEASLLNVNPKRFLKTFKENQLNIAEFQTLMDEMNCQVTEDFYKIYNKNKEIFNPPNN